METLAKRKLFGTDGVRGHANHEPMTVETALSVGRAFGARLSKKNGRRRVVIGKDTRLSCYMFENALIAGLTSMGIDTYMVGPLPTPGVAYITRAYRADAGIVISASHNPFYDNGIKFFSPEGFKLHDTIEQEIEEILEAGSYQQALPQDGALGRNHKIDDAQGRYIEFLKASFPRKLSLNGFNLVVDAGHGAGYKVGPLAFEELGATVTQHGANPNGTNINDNCGALHPEVMAQLVTKQKAHVGIALDGDADRCIMADEKGNVVDGDTILAICALHFQHKRVVGTVMTNFGIIKALERAGIEVVESNVGDRYVLHAMQENRITIGGEQSGHMIFLDHTTTGDGLLTALQVLTVMVETGKPLSELASVVTKYPQKLINVKVANKPPLETLEEVQEAIMSGEHKLQDKGRVLVRYSGTEPKCRVMVEGEEQALVDQIADEIASVITHHIGES